MSEKAVALEPTAYLQARFCQEVAKDRIDPEVFSSSGFRLENDGRCVGGLFHMNLPNFFPTSREAVERGFDWNRLPKVVPVGFVAGGDRYNLNDKKLQLKSNLEAYMKKLMNSEGLSELVQRNCTCLLQKLNSLHETYPELEKRDIKLQVHISGFSMGGCLAAATTIWLRPWEDCHGTKVVCTTFESPGMSDYDRRLALQQFPEELWRDRITNYVVLPNPINMFQTHLGKIVYLDTMDDFNRFSWAVRCIVATCSRFLLWASLIEYAASLPMFENVIELRGLAFQCTSRLRSAYGFVRSKIAQIPKVVTPWSVAASLSACFGMHVQEILSHHSLSSILTCFSSQSGLPHSDLAQEMRSWPSYTSVGNSLLHFLRDILQFLTPLHPGNPGVFTIHKRKEVLRWRMRKLKGFCPSGT